MKDWKNSGIKRRDERHTILPEIRPPGRSGKSTKRWCGGKVGVLHQPLCKAYSDLKNTAGITPMSREWRILVCSECDRVLDRWWPSPWTQPEKKPGWVVE